MQVATQSSYNKNLEVENYMIKGFKKISITFVNLCYGIDNMMYKIGKVIL